MTIRHIPFFCFVIAGQAVCVGVGLWLQHHLLDSAALAAVEHQMRAELEADASEIRSQLQAIDPRGLDAGPDVVAAALRTCAGGRLRKSCATITDTRGRVVGDSGAAGAEADAGLPAGTFLSWESGPDGAGGVAQEGHGILDSPGGPQLAVTRPLWAGKGALVVRMPLGEIQGRAAPLMESLTAIGIVTFLWIITLLGLTVYLTLARFRDTLDTARVASASGVLRQAQRLIRTRDMVIFALAKLAGSRDDETGAHLERISNYCTILAAALQQQPRFGQRVTPAYVRLIGASSTLHDIGKVGIPDAILHKPGSLTPEEHGLMQRHTAIAGDCLAEIIGRSGSSDFLEMAREIALAHHERWDGTGYPKGLRGEAIPLSARIVAIADAYDALAMKRAYKAALAHEDCVAIIRNGAGRQFDPDLVEVWLGLEARFRRVAMQYADGEADIGSGGEAAGEADTGGEAGADESGARSPARRPADVAHVETATPR